MTLIKLNHHNIEKEHLCCAMSDKKCQTGVNAKRTMIKNKLDEGYVFNKLDAKGKVFTDYCPVEISLLPVHADGYMAINCFWVSGQYAKQGHAKALLQQCIEDSRKSHGIIVISSDKKRPYLSDKAFFQHFGFEVCDKAPPYFELLVYKNSPEAPTPHFFVSAKSNRITNKKGFFIFYSEQCPFTDYYINTVFKNLAQEYGIPFESKKMVSRNEIQQLPTANNINSVFLDGEFITHEIMGPAKINKLCQHYRDR